MATQPVMNTQEQYDEAREPKIEGDDTVGAVEVDPSREVTRKRQSLSDLFTVVRALSIPWLFGLPTTN